MLFECYTACTDVCVFQGYCYVFILVMKNISTIIVFVRVLLSNLLSLLVSAFTVLNARLKNLSRLILNYLNGEAKLVN